MQLFLFNLNFNRFAPRIIRIFFAALFICTNTHIIILFTLGGSESFWSFRWATHLCTQKILFKIRCCGPHNLIAWYTASFFPFYVYFLFLAYFALLSVTDLFLVLIESAPLLVPTNLILSADLYAATLILYDLLGFNPVTFAETVEALETDFLNS